MLGVAGDGSSCWLAGDGGGRAGDGSLHTAHHCGGRGDAAENQGSLVTGTRAIGENRGGPPSSTSVCSICSSFFRLGSSLAPLLSFVFLSLPLGSLVTSSSSVLFGGGGVGVGGIGRGRRDRGASHWLEAVLEGRQRERDGAMNT